MKISLKSSFLFLALVAVVSGTFAVASNLTVESQSQHFMDEQNKVELEGDVRVKYDDVNVVSPRATVNLQDGKVKDVRFFEDTYSYTESKGKKHEIKARILRMSLLNKVVNAEGKVQSAVLDGQVPAIVVTSENQQYDNVNNVITADGGVVVQYEDIEAFSDSARVDLDKTNNISRIELTGNGFIKQKDSSIKADRFVYYADKQSAVAQGNVFTDAKDEKDAVKVWSDYQQFNRKTNIITASGHTKTEYKDFVATGPKATVFPDNRGKMNKIVFSGRSKIVQQNIRSVEADSIVLTLNPKDFSAEGNVKTFIGNIGGNGESKNEFSF